MTEAKDNDVRKGAAWFAVFVAAIIGMAISIDILDVQNLALANLMMASPIVFLIPAARAFIRKASKSKAGAPSARYIKRMLFVSLAYIASLLIAETVIEDGVMTPLALILALIPGLAVAGYFWAIGRLIVETKDEFVRMLVVRQSLIGTAVALSLASVWGFLENFELVPHVDAYWWAIAFFFGIGVGGIANKIQFGTTGECA